MRDRSHSHRSRKGRRLRGTRGVASAISVLFLILIMIAALNSYLVTTMPQQMAILEQQHVLQTENAFVQLRANILEEADHPNLHLLMNTPIPMQSQGMPPFGQPSNSILTANPTSSAAGNFSYHMGTVTPVKVNWSNGLPSQCSGSYGSITCTGNCGKTSGGTTVVHNVSGNGTTLTVNVKGSGCNTIYNVTGSNDTIDVSTGGSNNGNATVIIEGSNDIINVVLSGNTGNHRYAQFFIYGQHDQYFSSVTGGSSKRSGAGFSVNTTFVGYNGGLCPATTLSQTDSFAFTPSGYNVFQNVTWWNNQGIVNSNASNASWWGFNDTTHNRFIHFENDSGFVACAFTVVNGNTYGEESLSGIFDQLQNRYYPAESIGFEEGAVVAGTGPLSSTMIADPLISVNPGTNGYVVNITIIQLILATPQVRSGGGESSVETHLISESTIGFTNTPQSLVGKAPFLTNPFYLNVTTLYPMAWLDFFDSLVHVIPSSGATAIYAPQNGLSTWHVVAPITANGFTVRIVTVGISFN